MQTEINFMGHENFTLTPFQRMKIIWTSGILGEPQYYRDGQTVFLDSLRLSLDYDYRSTIDFANELRNTYHMRKGSQVIMVEAALHNNRVFFNNEHPGYFRSINKRVIGTPVDVLTQFEHYKAIRDMGKARIPGILKRSWREALEGFSPYELDKYKTKGKLVDLIRICHPRSRKNQCLCDLVYDNSISKDWTTWERLRSEGKTWEEIVRILKPFPHMALLRNINSISKSMDPTPLFEHLENGVKTGKQFPFRYYSAYQACDHPEVKKSLERCIKLSISNLPKIEGNIVSLCDNSGSAWGTFTSTYGKQTIATIGNLSGLVAAMCATGDGYVGVFGDHLEMYKVDKERGIFEQLEEIDTIGREIGAATENGVWLFFRDSLDKKIPVFDHLFIYSDMQAGHGKLYGLDPSQYAEYVLYDRYINVIDLIGRYRGELNEKLNVFTVQTAAYDNSLIPEFLYRGAILSGWTGNEINFAHTLMSVWDSVAVVH